MVRCLLQLSERWHCHIWLIGRMKYTSFEANVGGVGAFESIPCFSFSLCGGGGGPNMTEILLNGTLYLNSKTINGREKTWGF